MKDSTVEELAYQIKHAKSNNSPKPIVFLGAGISKTGNIPLANEIVKDVLEKYKESPKISKIKTSIKGSILPSYAEIMEALLPYERNNLLKEYINKAKINMAHIYLANLICNDYVDYVLTVNFDNLILKSLALYNEFPPTYDMAVLKDFTTTTFKEKSVIYLHGQHHGLWLLNTREEMDKVKKIIPKILNQIMDRLWIFIGYSGEDKVFEQIVKLGRFDKGLYWVTYMNYNPSNKVCNILKKTQNNSSFFIKGYDADTFLANLHNTLELPKPEIIENPFITLQRYLENILIRDEECFKEMQLRLSHGKEQVNSAMKEHNKYTNSDNISLQGTNKIKQVFGEQELKEIKINSNLK